MCHIHPSDYYDASAANLGRVKARWDREEYVLMAREELRLAASGCGNINHELVKYVAGRTFDAIKSEEKFDLQVFVRTQDGSQDPTVDDSDDIDNNDSDDDTLT